MVQVQLNQDKIDEVNARLLELIDTQLADARAQLDDAEAQIAAGRAEYEKQLKTLATRSLTPSWPRWVRRWPTPSPSCATRRRLC